MSFTTQLQQPLQERLTHLSGGQVMLPITTKLFL